MGYMSFRHLLYDVLHVDFLSLFLYSYRSLVHIQQEFLNFVFYIVVYCNCMRVLFLDKFGNVLICFLYCECF